MKESNGKVAERTSKTEMEADVIQLLHKDHQTVAELFFQFSQSDKKSEKERLVETILKELYMHTTVEEEIVYPAIRKEVDDSDDMMDEADTEHHMVKLLMSELAGMKSSDDHYDSKVTVLGELVRHHVREEEKEMFEQMNEADMDLEELGAAVAKRKAALKKADMPAIKKPITTSSRNRSKKK
jgi:hemerythrin superfamily protein